MLNTAVKTVNQSVKCHYQLPPSFLYKLLDSARTFFFVSTYLLTPDNNHRNLVPNCLSVLFFPIAQFFRLVTVSCFINLREVVILRFGL